MFKKLSLVIAIVVIAGMAAAMAATPKAEAASEAKPNPHIPLFTAEKPPTVYLFKNVKVFDGISDQLKDVDVLVVNNLIRKIGKDLPVSGTYNVNVKAQQFEKVTVPPSAYDFNTGYVVQVPKGDGKVETKKIPVTVIDGGGRLGMTITADGVDAIKAAGRQNFMQGATQLKIMSSGGVVSQFDPWQLDAYSAEEIRAAVEVADAYHSYVMSHAYSKKSIMRCLENGVKTIEHGFMIDDEAAKLMQKKGAYLTTNMQAFSPALAQVEAIAASPVSKRKADSAQLAFKDFVKTVKKHRPKMGYNNDYVGNDEQAYQKQAFHQIYLGAHFFGNHYWLKALTSVNGEILKLSSEVNDPYPEGKLGVVEEGAYADLLLVDGNPLKDISAIGGNEKWFDAPDQDGIKTMRIIMKDGVIYKNTL